MFDKETFLSTLQTDGYVEVGPWKVERIQNDIYHMDTETKAWRGGECNAQGVVNNPSSIYFVQEETGTVMIDLANPVEEHSEMEQCAKFIVEWMTDGNPLSILLTHGHFDHTGLAQSPNVFSSVCIEAIYVPDGDQAMAAEALAQWKDKISIVSNTTLSLYQDTYQFVTIGGHTPGSLVIANANKEVLWTGDTFGSGYVWEFWDSQQDGNPLKALEMGIPTVLELLSSMSHPIILAGHRWQQFKQDNPERPEEMTPQYFRDMQKVLDGLRDGSSVCEPYPAAAHISTDAVEVCHAGAHAKIDTLPLFISHYQK